MQLKKEGFRKGCPSKVARQGKCLSAQMTCDNPETE